MGKMLFDRELSAGKVMIGSFTSTDLLKYAESLLREARSYELKSVDRSNYSWLQTKLPPEDVQVYLEGFRPMIMKMSPENCTAVAVKLDILSEQSMSTEHILTSLGTLLREQDSMQIMAGTVKRAKETKIRNVKVHPVLYGRQPTVSFVVQDNKLID